ncbi:histone-fold-containing protein [Mycena capillaripes]|nr:histone-fold-containing protein [Mycena capillaripes]
MQPPFTMAHSIESARKTTGGINFWSRGKGHTASRPRGLRNNIRGVTKPALRRLARRGGVKRISQTVHEDVRGALKIFPEGVMRDTTLYTEHGCRKTVTQLDVMHALKRNGMSLYGFGG